MINENMYRERFYPKDVRAKVRYVSDNIQFVSKTNKIDNFKVEPIVICLVKNGALYVRKFIEHYIEIGIKHIVLMDNGSNDQTVRIASEYEQIVVIRCNLPFKEYKLAMRIYLAQTFCCNRWCLNVDIDELWEYPFCNTLRINTFLEYLEESKYTACVSHVLDLFAEGKIQNANINEEHLNGLRYFDLSDIYYWKANEKRKEICPDKRMPIFFLGNHLSKCDTPILARGVRWKLFGITPILTKISLFKLVDQIVPFISSSHRVMGAMIADISCVILHYLINNNLHNKAKMCSKERSYFNESEHYRIIDKILSSAPVKLPEKKYEYRTINELIDLKFLFISNKFAKFVKSNS